MLVTIMITIINIIIIIIIIINDVWAERTLWMGWLFDPLYHLCNIILLLFLM